ncbi:MAG: DUF1624 domain-containing protein [Methyloceanibacter sp.]
MQESPLAKPKDAETSARTRIESIDLLRGLVVALMALDHTRGFFSDFGFNPRDVAEPALFLTRWITHFCAPAFILLAGLSAYLYGCNKTTGEISRFLLVRGLWLILLEFTLIQFGWSFSPGLPSILGGGIIWVIGACMVLMAALVYLPRAVLAAFALVLIAGHNLFDGVRAEDFGGAAWLWHILHQPGRTELGGVAFYVLYPLIPWIGVMAAGYLLGPVMQRPPRERQRILLGLGAAITIGFVLLRATNLYGDPAPWSVQETALATVLSFLNCQKYPPSLLFLMMTLGPALMLLAAFEHARGRVADWLKTFGKVPFFFYVAHIYLIHALAVITAFALTGALVLSRPDLAFGLPGVYAMWVVVLVLLYPLCRWFAGLKERRGEWWWRYL